MTDFRTPMRNVDRFHSPFTEWVNKAASRTMYLMDLDGVFYKVATRIYRVFESKHWGEKLSPGEEKILPILARQISADVQAGDLADGSGVYIVEGNPPYDDGACVTQIMRGGVRRPHRVSGDELLNLVACETLEPWRTTELVYQEMSPAS